MTDATRSKPAGRKLAKKLALSLALVPVTLLVLDIGFRVWLALHGEAYDAARTLESLAADSADLAEPGRNEAAIPNAIPGASEGSTLHPFVGYWSSEDFERVARLSEYYRTPESKQVYDVVILGGSVAAGYGYEARAQLAPLLAASSKLAGRPVEIRGFGHAGFKQPQQVALLVYFLAAGHEPDAVISLDGFNELAVASENARRGANPLFPSYFEIGNLLRDRAADPAAARAALAVADRRARIASLLQSAHPALTARSAIAGTLLLRRVHRLHSEALAALADYRKEIASQPFPLSIRGPRHAVEPDEVRRDCVRAWSEGARTLQAICRARGIHYLHVLQPALHDPGSKPMTERERNSVWPAEWIEDIRRGYPLLRAAGQELVRDGVNFLDASRVFADTEQEIYRDGCHFGTEGCEILSRFIAPVFLSTLEVQGSAAPR